MGEQRRLLTGIIWLDFKVNCTPRIVREISRNITSISVMCRGQNFAVFPRADKDRRQLEISKLSRNQISGSELVKSYFSSQFEVNLPTFAKFELCIISQRNYTKLRKARKAVREGWLSRTFFCRSASLKFDPFYSSIPCRRAVSHWRFAIYQKFVLVACSYF